MVCTIWVAFDADARPNRNEREQVCLFGRSSV
jgi:hypothetical protein